MNELLLRLHNQANEHIIREKFWDRVEKTESCWLWTGARSPTGYGNIYIFKSYISTHRLSWLINFWNIPIGLDVCHHCDNPPCCNPNHLFLGTAKQNIQDSIRKGRWLSKSRHAKVTAENVSEMRRLSLEGHTRKHIANLFGVTPQNISCILLGQTWNK
jgi:hypothetical protein